MSSTPPETDQTQTTRGLATQLPRNLAANITYFLANIVIGVLLVPYFINTLGVAAYGIIPLATSITGYVAVVVQSLNTSVTRFLTVDLQRGDYAAANKTFNTALFGLTVVILLMVPVIIVVAYFVPAIFHVPAGQETGVILLFLGVSAAFLIRSWSGNFTAQLFAYNRLDLQNLVNLTKLTVQTGLIVLLFTLLGPDLGLVVGAYLIGAIVASGVAIVLARRVCPHLRVSIRSFDRRRIRDRPPVSHPPAGGRRGALRCPDADDPLLLCPETDRDPDPGHEERCQTGGACYGPPDRSCLRTCS